MMKMMKFYLLAAAAVAAISCSKEVLPENIENPTPEVELVPMTFTASYEPEISDTKVTYENGATVWNIKDKIMVISESGIATEFTATSVSADGKSATFEGSTETAETYYAVSPASAYVGNDVANGKIYANIPETQTAIAGTFDPKAFLSVAQNNGSTLEFKNACAVIKFTLDNPAGLKSIRFTANNETNIAGTGAIKTENIPIHSWDSDYEKRSAYNMITLNAPEEGFAVDKEYYLTIRGQITCADGIKVYLESESGLKFRSSNNPLFTSGTNNYVRSLGVLDKNLSDATPYDLYNFGFDLTVAGKTINNATYGDATLISSSSTSKGLGKSGVYFVNSDVTATFNSGITGNLIVIGNTPGVRSNVSRTGVSYLSASEGQDALIMHNIKYVDCNANVFQLNNANSFETIIFDNCLLNITSGYSLILSTSAANTITDFIMSNCDIKMAGSVSLMKMGGSTINGITVENNVLYADSEMTSFFAVNTTATVNSVAFNNNTLYNTTIGTTTTNEDAIVKANTITGFTAKNNYVVYANSTANRYFGRASFSEGEVDNNFYIRKDGTYTSIYGVPGTIPSWVINQPAAKDAPSGLITNWDPENGQYILGGYSGVGATR